MYFKDFFKRNSPIFYIGIVVAVIFVFIIILGQKAPTTSPNLQPVNEKDLISDSNNILGFKDSRVTIVEFLDYNCPYCKQITPSIKNLLDGNKNKVRVVIKHLPLVGLKEHETSYLAASAVQTAKRFNKGEEMHYALIEASEINKDYIMTLVDKFGINKDEYTKLLESDEIKKEVDADIQTATNLGIQSTPTIFINGRKIDLQKQDLSTTTIAEINRLYPQQ